MAVALLLLLGFLLPLANSQNFPHVSFRGQTLASHFYVDISIVGDGSGGSSVVQCITDLSTCCTRSEGSHRGDWFSPAGTRLPFSGDITQNRGSQRVELRRRNNAHTLVGIYRCSISRYVRATICGTVYCQWYVPNIACLVHKCCRNCQVATLQSHYFWQWRLLRATNKVSNVAGNSRWYVGRPWS